MHQSNKNKYNANEVYLVELLHTLLFDIISIEKKINNWKHNKKG